MLIHRRDWLRAALGSAVLGRSLFAAEANPPLKITGIKITPIALPDPPLLASSGCHGPYFLRNIVQIETDGGITGIGETHGGQKVTEGLEQAKEIVLGKNAFAYRKFAAQFYSEPPESKPLAPA